MAEWLRLGRQILVKRVRAAVSFTIIGLRSTSTAIVSLVDVWAGEGEAHGLTCLCNGSTVSEHGSRAVDLSAGLARLGACGLATRVAAGASRFAQHLKYGTQRRKDALRTTGGIKTTCFVWVVGFHATKPGLPRPSTR